MGATVLRSCSHPYSPLGKEADASSLECAGGLDLTHSRILPLEFGYSTMDVWMFPENLLLQVGLSIPSRPFWARLSPASSVTPSLGIHAPGLPRPSSHLQCCVIHSTLKSGPASLFSLLCAFASSLRHSGSGRHRILEGTALG